jgi:hypothetical protein
MGARRSAGFERILRFAALAFPMAQDAVDHPRLCNNGDDLHPGTAFADKRVNFKDFSEQARPGAPGFYPWAQLMERVFELDVLSCPRCGGRMRILAAINPPDAIEKILACLGLPTRAPPIAPPLSDTEKAYSW